MTEEREEPCIETDDGAAAAPRRHVEQEWRVVFEMPSGGRCIVTEVVTKEQAETMAADLVASRWTVRRLERRLVTEWHSVPYTAADA